MKNFNLRYANQRLTKEQMKQIVAGEEHTCPCGVQWSCYVGDQTTGAPIIDTTITSCRDFDSNSADNACYDANGPETENGGCQCAPGC